MSKAAPEDQACPHPLCPLLLLKKPVGTEAAVRLNCWQPLAQSYKAACFDQACTLTSSGRVSPSSLEWKTALELQRCPMSMAKRVAVVCSSSHWSSPPALPQSAAGAGAGQGKAAGSAGFGPLRSSLARAPSNSARQALRICQHQSEAAQKTLLQLRWKIFCR